MRRDNRLPAYIWQKDDWPHFVWNSDEIMSLLENVNRLHGLLSGRLSAMGIVNREKSQLDAMVAELISSAEIEGMALNPVSVRSSIARKLGLEGEGLVKEDHYVEGLVDVMMDAVKNCTTPLSATRLFDWHAALFPTGRSGMYKITVADWRRGSEPMQVVSGAVGRQKVHYEAPPSERVDEMMAGLMEWANTASMSPILKSGILHLWFVTIHPFDDGNGRLSRTVADMFLSRLDTPEHSRYYSVSAEINQSKREYYEILERTQKGGLDITEWLKWYLKLLEGAINSSLQAIDRTLEKSRFWDRHRDVEVNERQRKVLNRLWDGFDGKLTSSKWAKICHCSQDTATRDINDLIKKEMLVKAESGGRSVHYHLP